MSQKGKKSCFLGKVVTETGFFTEIKVRFDEQQLLDELFSLSK